MPLSAALPRELQEPQHRHHHAHELRQARAARRQPRHHGARDGTQLRLATRPRDGRQVSCDWSASYVIITPDWLQLRARRRGRELHHVRPRDLGRQDQQQEVLPLQPPQHPRGPHCQGEGGQGVLHRWGEIDISSSVSELNIILF